MYVVKIDDGFQLATFEHYCDAVDFVEALPGSGPENARIVTQHESGELTMRLSAWKRARAKQIRTARKTRSATKWGAM